MNQLILIFVFLFFIYLLLFPRSSFILPTLLSLLFYLCLVLFLVFYTSVFRFLIALSSQLFSFLSLSLSRYPSVQLRSLASSDPFPSSRFPIAAVRWRDRSWRSWAIPVTFQSAGSSRQTRIEAPYFSASALPIPFALVRLVGAEELAKMRQKSRVRKKNKTTNTIFFFPLNIVTVFVLFF